MNAAIHRLCVWSGIGMMVLWLGGFWLLCGLVPPPSPALDAVATAQVYLEHRNAVRAGLIVSVFGTAMLAAFVTALSLQMRRMVVRGSPLPGIQFGLGMLTVIEFVIPLMLMQTATFRPDRDAEIIQALSDVSWLILGGLVATVYLEFLVVGVAILCDRNPEPVMPRWMGYMSVWITALWLPACSTVFFKDGIFAWNGLMVWWLPLGSFAVWLIAMTWCLLRALRLQELGSLPGSGSSAREWNVDARVEALAAELVELRAQVSVR